MKLYFVGDATSDIEITKDGRKYLYFTAKTNLRKYRIEKATGLMQAAPYWYTVKGMRVGTNDPPSSILHKSGLQSLCTFPARKELLSGGSRVINTLPQAKGSTKILKEEHSDDEGAG